jgi:hypothetical protein
MVPTMGTPPISKSRSPRTPSGSVAVALAVLPASGPEPRVIQQFTSTFLVDRHGDIWRVYDANTADSTERCMPSVSTFPFRIFIALARNAERRVHAFARNAGRDVDPVSLQMQLDASTGA